MSGVWGDNNGVCEVNRGAAQVTHMKHIIILRLGALGRVLGIPVDQKLLKLVGALSIANSGVGCSDVSGPFHDRASVK